MRFASNALLLLALAGSACGDDDGVVDAIVDPADTGGPDAPVVPDAAQDTGPPHPGCARTAAAPDRTRYVVVSHPFGASGPAPRFEVLTLDSDGELDAPGTFFDLGDRPAGGGEIAFTPDGQVGLVALDDGTVGVFTLDEAGVPTVVHASFSGPFYAGGVVVAPSGDRAYVLDHDVMPERGGGVYEVAIRCDGTLVDMGRVLSAAGPQVLRFHLNGTAILAARGVVGGDAGDDVFVLSDSPLFGVRSGADAFGDDDAIATEVAITGDGRFALIGDNSIITENRVAVVFVDGEATPTQVLPAIPDPIDIVTSPFLFTAIVVSGVDGDAILVLDYDATEDATPFSVRGELTYVGTRPQLPANAVVIEQGSLTGLVLIAENLAVRRVRFGSTGEVTDLGAFGTGSGSEAIVGILGVTP